MAEHPKAPRSRLPRLDLYGGGPEVFRTMRFPLGPSSNPNRMGLVILEGIPSGMFITEALARTFGAQPRTADALANLLDAATAHLTHPEDPALRQAFGAALVAGFEHLRAVAAYSNPDGEPLPDPPPLLRNPTISH